MPRLITPSFLAAALIAALAPLAPVAVAQIAHDPDAAGMPDTPGMPDAAEMIRRIAQADANGDGRITRTELIAYRAQQFGRLDRNGDGFIDMRDVPGLMASRFEPRMRQLQARFDANRDGRISRDEFVNGPTPGFDMADANHDGVVTAAEIRVALAKFTTMRSR